MRSLLVLALLVSFGCVAEDYTDADVAGMSQDVLTNPDTAFGSVTIINSADFVDGTQPQADPFEQNRDNTPVDEESPDADEDHDSGDSGDKLPDVSDTPDQPGNTETPDLGGDTETPDLGGDTETPDLGGGSADTTSTGAGNPDRDGDGVPDYLGDPNSHDLDGDGLLDPDGGGTDLTPPMLSE